jgi:hypothetical protein
MPLRILEARLRDLLLPCCGPEEVEKIVGILVHQEKWRPPMTTLVDVDSLENLPVGTAVLVGNIQDPDRYLHVGMVGQHCVLFAGEEHPYPFHEDGGAPPLPCTVIWNPLEDGT